MMTTNRSTFGLLGLAALLATACADPNARNQPPQRAQLAQAIATPQRREPPPERLSPLAMAALKSRMASHARDMDRLVSAIMVLDYADIARRANEIVGRREPEPAAVQGRQRAQRVATREVLPASGRPQGVGQGAVGGGQRAESLSGSRMPTEKCRKRACAAMPTIGREPEAKVGSTVAA